MLLAALPRICFEGVYLTRGGEVLRAQNKASLKKEDLLSFSEVVRLCLKSEKELTQTQGKQASLALSWMCRHKKAHLERRFAITRLFLKILDCLCNFLRGYGFRTTLSLAEKLQERWGSITPPPSPVKTPISVEKRRSALLRCQQNTCTMEDMGLLVSNLDLTRHNSIDSLINKICGTANLEKPRVQSVIVDMFRVAMSEKMEPIADWLLKKPVPAKLMEEILNAFSRERLISYEALRKLINRAQTLLSPNDPALLSATLVYLTKVHTLDLSTKMVDWFCKRSDFSFESWVRLTFFYVELQKDKSVGYPIGGYGGYDALLKTLLSRNWEERLSSSDDKKAQSIQAFLSGPEYQPIEYEKWVPRTPERTAQDGL